MSTAKDNFKKFLKERNEKRDEILQIINDAKEMDFKDAKPQYKKAAAIYLQLRKIENNKIKKNTFFKDKEAFEKEYPDFKRYSIGKGDTGKLYTDKDGLNDKYVKHVNQGSEIDRAVLRAKKSEGSASTDPPQTEEEPPKKKDKGKGKAKEETKEEDKDVPMATPVDQSLRGKDPAEKKTDEDKEEGAQLGTKQGERTVLLDEKDKEEELELDPFGKSTTPLEDARTMIANNRLNDFLANLTEEQAQAVAQYFEAGESSETQLDHQEKFAFAQNKMMKHLGEGWKNLDPDRRNIMIKYYYSQAHIDKPPEASQPSQPDVNNNQPGATSQQPGEQFTAEDIDSLGVEGDENINQAEAERGAEAQAEPNNQQFMDQPEFRTFNPQFQNVDIEIDDTTPAGTFDPVQGGSGGSGGNVPGFQTLGAGGLTSSNLLNSVNFPTDEAQKLIEDRMRNKKSIETLKDEIRCMHIIYDDEIKTFKESPHQKDKNDALESKDVNKVKAHHKKMQDMIRNYYKTSDLKVGVILSAESFFGTSFASHPNLAALSQPRVPELNPSRVRAVKPGHEFDNSVVGNTRVNRLGRNYKKPVKRNVPKVGEPPIAQQVQAPPQVPDIEEPLRGQRGFRRRRINQQVGMPIIIKTGKN